MFMILKVKTKSVQNIRGSLAIYHYKSVEWHLGRVCCGRIHRGTYFGVPQKSNSTETGRKHGNILNRYTLKN